MSQSVLVAVDDLFFSTKIAETARRLGIAIAFAGSQDEVIARALTERPALVVIDLNATRLTPIETIGQMKDDAELRDIPIVGFLSHVQADLKVRATIAGCDRVLPRSVFSARLPMLLAEYATGS
jgi:CheY-like chemotaxis protein